MIYVAHPNPAARVGLPIDTRHIERVEGSSVVLKSGKRVRTGETNANLLTLMIKSGAMRLGDLS